MKRILCIWLPHWPIQRLRAARPELKDRAALPANSAADRAALEALAQRCARFSPAVGLEQSDTPDSLLLDVTGLEHLFGGEAALAAQIVDDFAQQGLAVRVAIADTLGAAWAAARYEGWKAEGGRRRSEWAVENGERAVDRGSGIEHRGLSFGNWGFDDQTFRLPPSAFFLVPPGEADAALRPLPIEALRLPEEVLEPLHQLGIRCIGQLEKLPRSELTARFGPRLLQRMDQAAGRLPEPVPIYQSPPPLRADWSPEHPTGRREVVEAALEHLLRRVAQLLAERGCGAMRLECRLECRPAEPVQISVGLFEPTASAGHLGQLVRVQLERLRLPGPISGISVGAAATAPLELRQEELFTDGPRRWHPRQLAALVERLGSRLGRGAVVRARLRPEAQPELAWQYEPLVDHPRRRPSRQPPPEELPPRPLRMLPEPIRIDLRWGLSQFLRSKNGTVPFSRTQFCLYGRRHQIAHAWGPERIEAGWWRGRAVERDYYRVETTAGRRFWLFRRFGDGEWFVQGVFE